MSELFGKSRARFEVVGLLTEKRLVTPKNSESSWRLYVLKFAVPGSTVEVEVTKDEFDAAVEHEGYLVTGDVGVVAGRIKLQAVTIRREGATEKSPRVAG